MGKTIAAIEADIRTKFEPVPVLATSTKMRLVIQQAIQYFNGNYNQSIMETVDITAGSPVTLPARVRQVQAVFDVKQESDSLANQELLQYFYLKYRPAAGRILTYQEMIALQLFYNTTEGIFFAQVNWKHMPGTPGGTSALFFKGFTNSFLTIQYKYWFNPNDLSYQFDDYPLDWIYRYALALTKIDEGTILRKSISVDIPSDGTDMVTDGTNEKAFCEAELQGRTKLFCITSGR
jgi:hypothetical protein